MDVLLTFLSSAFIPLVFMPSQLRVIAAMLVVFAVGPWVLALVAGRPPGRAIALVAAMAGVLVLLLAVPQARQVFAWSCRPSLPARG